MHCTVPSNEQTLHHPSTQSQSKMIKMLLYYYYIVHSTAVFKIA